MKYIFSNKILELTLETSNEVNGLADTKGMEITLVEKQQQKSNIAMSMKKIYD